MMVPYNIVVNEVEKSAEVNLYGEIVTTRPRDFWTDEPVEGLYIVLDEFLKELDILNSSKSVVFHINSPGGEVAAGVSIYNRMKQMQAKVTTIVDGLAASAASIIAQGASEGCRKVAYGTLTMIHSARIFMFGYYNAGDLKTEIASAKAHDRSIAEIYEQCTGLNREKIGNMMSATTWMTAQEAVDNGFADEIIDTGSNVVMSLNSDRSCLTVNGVMMSIKGLFYMPDKIRKNIQVMAGEMTSDVIDQTETGGKGKMTVDEVKIQNPELYEQIRSSALEEAVLKQQEAVDKAVSAEVSRLKAIDEIAGKIPDKDLVERAKYGEAKMSAGDLALEALKVMNTTEVCIQGAQADFLRMMHDDAVKSGAEGVEPTPNQGSLSVQEQAAKDIADGAALLAGVSKEGGKV